MLCVSLIRPQQHDTDLQENEKNGKFEKNNKTMTDVEVNNKRYLSSSKISETEINSIKNRAQESYQAHHNKVNQFTKMTPDERLKMVLNNRNVSK
jgi:hypothetical protein